MAWLQRIQTFVDILYPAACISCAAPIDGDTGLCSSCWLATPFISGLVCETCGQPLIGESHETEQCDDCLTDTRPWQAGRAALVYDDRSRKLVWDLKYADRTEIAKVSARWMLNAAREILPENPLFVPIPLHWTRLLKRKYNQSDLLAQAMAKQGGYEAASDLLRRIKRTPPLIGLDKDERAAWLQGAITPHPKRGIQLADRNVVLVDDVMTTGATLSAAADACHIAKAKMVFAVFLARASKSD